MFLTSRATLVVLCSRPLSSPRQLWCLWAPGDQIAHVGVVAGGAETSRMMLTQLIFSTQRVVPDSLECALRLIRTRLPMLHRRFSAKNPLKDAQAVADAAADV